MVRWTSLVMWCHWMILLRQAQFDASNVSYSASDMPVDALVGGSAAIIWNSVDWEVQTENDNTCWCAITSNRCLRNTEWITKISIDQCYILLDRFSNNDNHVAYYTGFKNFEILMTFWHYLGDKVNHLTLWHGKQTIVSGLAHSELRPIELGILFVFSTFATMSSSERPHF